MKNTTLMVVTFLRTLIIFLTLIVVMRLMGKRQIGEMQPFEFIVTLIIADLACIPMADISIPLIYGIVAILGLFLLHQLFSLLEQCGNFCKRVISGKPSVVINKLGVDIKELKRNNMGVDDLIESMRAAGYFSLDDLDYAIFESNGKLSALKNCDRGEIKTSIPLLIVNDGKPVTKNLARANIDSKMLENIISGQHGKIKDTEVMTVDGNGRIYYKSKNQKYRILSCSLSGDTGW